MMRDIYLIGGLGADQRVFKNLKLSDHNVKHINWIEPLDNESVSNYAGRLLSQIRTPNPTIIGVSFGGLIATEIGKLIQTDKIILISSAKTKKTIPYSYRTLGYLRFNRLIPAFMLKQANTLTYHMFGASTRKDKDLLKAIITETNNKFLKWAIEKILTWQNLTELTNVITIHGTNDKILPLKSSDYQIHNGGHFMIVDKANEIIKILNPILSRSQNITTPGNEGL
jgi:pimeloyl-ACP methyl ester carboxylesterase